MKKALSSLFPRDCSFCGGEPRGGFLAPLKSEGLPFSPLSLSLCRPRAAEYLAEGPRCVPGHTRLTSQAPGLRQDHSQVRRPGMLPTPSQLLTLSPGCGSRPEVWGAGHFDISSYFHCWSLLGGWLILPYLLGQLGLHPHTGAKEPGSERRRGEGRGPGPASTQLLPAGSWGFQIIVQVGATVYPWADAMNPQTENIWGKYYIVADISYIVRWDPITMAVCTEHVQTFLLVIIP